ncbi:MAG: hypothetical protein ACO29O_03825 [Chitinophagaceae bacterium]
MMKRTFLYILTAFILLSCHSGKDIPDISHIKVNLQVMRFDKDLFALDSSNLNRSIASLSAKYPQFYRDFMTNILGVDPKDSMAGEILVKFIHDFKVIKEKSDQKFQNIDAISSEVKDLLRRTKYYFPEYRQPEKLIAFIGPMDAFYENSLGWSGDIITSEGLAIGLQMHLGSDAPFYAESQGSGYPLYISRRFEPEYIVVNCARNIVDDIFPEKSVAVTLVEQMVDKGKRMYAVDQLLPTVPDSIKIGYTASQLKACYNNEGLIWNMFLQNNLIYESDFQKTKSFLSEGPKTAELGDDSPGYITLFTGWQIVKAYMEKYPKTSLIQLMDLDNRKLFELSKYKPK